MTQPLTDRRTLSKALVALAREAGAAIMALYAGDIRVTEKADASPVTAADHAAEAIILRGLRQLAGGVPVISEEAFAAGAIPAVGDTFFLVDPLDGTKEFLNRNGEFTVNIALIEKGEPTMGVVFAPAIQRLFYAAGPGLAFEVDPTGSPRPIRVRKINPQAIVAVASRSHRDPETDAYLAQFAIAQFKPAGSSLKFCLVAAGEADLYPRFGPTMEWDTAAGHAVLRAAGGSVKTTEGAPLRYGKTAAGYRNPSFVARGAE